MSVRELAKIYLLANFPLPCRLQKRPQYVFGCLGHVRVLDGVQRVWLWGLSNEQRTQVLYIGESKTHTSP